MSLIFDRFPSTDKAEAFVAEVREQFHLVGGVYASQLKSNEIDPFPFELIPPIVLIDRPRYDDADVIERLVVSTVSAFDGEFAGT